jgi:hypothetical protein
MERRGELREGLRHSYWTGCPALRIAAAPVSFGGGQEVRGARQGGCMTDSAAHVADALTPRRIRHGPGTGLHGTILDGLL